MSGDKVNWFTGVKPAEIYQSFNMKFAFANEVDGKIVQCHQWVKCRDFLHDAVRTMLTGEKSSIWSFTFEKGKNPDIAMDKIMFLVSKKDVTNAAKFRPVLTKALKLINYFENLNGVELSTIKKVEADKKAGYAHVWLLTGPKFWLTAPYLVSLYTFLLRLGDKNIEFKDATSLKKALETLSKQDNTNNENDLKYLKQVWNKMETLVTRHEDLADLNKEGFSGLYYTGASISSFHNRTGVVSACTAATWSKDFNKKVTKALKESN